MRSGFRPRLLRRATKALYTGTTRRDSRAAALDEKRPGNGKLQKMFDIRWIRDNPAAFDAGLGERGLDPVAHSLIELDEKRRTLVAALQDMQERRNAASKDIGQAKAAKDEARAQALMAEVAELKTKMPEQDAAAKAAEEELRTVLSGLPNLPFEDVPVGPDETANVEIRKVGAPRAFEKFEPRQHFELGEGLGLMDFETAAKLSGARFVVLKGALARLERALGCFMLDVQTGEHGYTEINPPLMVRDDAMFGTAQLPKFARGPIQDAEHNLPRRIERVRIPGW